MLNIKSLVIAMIASGCIHLPAMEPQPRGYLARERAAVAITVECAWGAPRTASGVAISERHILTAAHVTECPTIPTIRVWFFDADGEVDRQSRFAVVEREDLDSDVALIEVFAQNNIGRGYVPPTLSREVEVGCAVLAFPKREVKCGEFLSQSTLDVSTRSGNSGSGVYDQDGALVGIVSSSLASGSTYVARVNETWLRGVLKP